MAETLLELARVGKFYTGAQSVVVGLNSVSLSFSRGEFVAVTGESGSGKSTLVSVCGGLIPYESGEMFFNGKPTSHYSGLDWERYRRDNISFISQNYGILPGASVMRNVMSALIITGMDTAEAKRSAKDILNRVDLWELRNRRAAKLSSGQKQRLSIARALVKPAPILIADEPTGNLDSENSKKIIELLADAARERLVILVTHEFDEAKDLATRHIVIQDGRVASDTELRKAPEPQPAPVRSGKGRRFLSAYVARLQCLSRPVWTAMTAAFFAITAFAVFAFLGVLITSIDDTSTKIYDDSAFANGDPTRIVVTSGNPGASSLSDDDIEKILGIPHVKEVEPWACISDIRYAYREGVDFETGYYEVSVFDPDVHDYVPETRSTYIVKKTAPFAKTVPILPEGEVFLTGGRLPENLYEVVSGDESYCVGDFVKIRLVNFRTMPRDSYIELSCQVVGTTDRGEGFYFHGDMGRLFTQSYLNVNVSSTVADHGFMYLPNNPLDIPEGALKEQEADPAPPSLELPSVEEGHYVGSANIFYDRNLPESPDDVKPRTFYSDDADENGNHREYVLMPTVSGSVEDGFDYEYIKQRVYSKIVCVDYDAFNTLCWQTRNEIGVTVTDYAYVDGVLSALEKLGYPAMSVYRQGAVKQDPDLAAERVQTLRICIVVLIAAAVLQVVVLRAMFSLQNDSYRLLGNIGLTGKTAKRSVVIQIAAFTVFGELIGAAGILICSSLGVEKIVAMLRYLTPPYLCLLAAVHMLLALIASVWIVRALGKQVYPLGTVSQDIELDEDGEAEA